MGDYASAEHFFQKSLEIFENLIPTNHPYLAISCNNIAMVNNTMGHYTTPLEFYEQSHKIFQRAVSSHHPV